MAQIIGDSPHVSANIPDPCSIRYTVVSLWIFCAFWSLTYADLLEDWDMRFCKTNYTCMFLLACCLLSILQKESPFQTAPQKFLYLKITTIKSLHSPFGFSSYILHDSRKSLNMEGGSDTDILFTIRALSKWKTENSNLAEGSREGYSTSGVELCYSKG